MKAISLGTTESIVIALGGAITTTQPTYLSCYSDTTGDAVGNSKGATNSGSEVTAIAAPASGYRQVDALNIYNEDTVAVVATVSIAVGASRYKLGVYTLQPGQAIDVMLDAIIDVSKKFRTSMTFYYLGPLDTVDMQPVLRSKNTGYIVDIKYFRNNAVAPGSNGTILIKKNGSTIYTCTIGTGDANQTWILVSLTAIAVAAGDSISAVVTGAGTTITDITIDMTLEYSLV